MFVYALFAVEFFVRYGRDLPIRSRIQSVDALKMPKATMTRKLKMMTGALILSTILLLIRCVSKLF
jgi:hypothetical protein